MCAEVDPDGLTDAALKLCDRASPPGQLIVASTAGPGGFDELLTRVIRCTLPALSPAVTASDSEWVCTAVGQVAITDHGIIRRVLIMQAVLLALQCRATQDEFGSMH